jgi:hypothetical protein
MMAIMALEQGMRLATGRSSAGSSSQRASGVHASTQLVALCVAAALAACSIDAVTFPQAENCQTAGDEDGNGMADCADPACGGTPVCQAVRPCELVVTSLEPATLFEGTGVGGSRPALLVITGKNLVSQSSTVSITAAAGSTRAPLLMVDTARIEVGAAGTHLAVPITLSVDPALPATETISLDVKVEQDCPEARVTGTISGQLTLKGLGELTSAAALLMGGLHEYSQIDVGAGTLSYAFSQTSPIILRSMSSVKIANTIYMDASGQYAGPAGGSGGASVLYPSQPQSPGYGPCPGQSSGEGACFDDTDPWLNTLGNLNRGSGGASAYAFIDSLGQTVYGGAGGGGGGSIEISAGGHLQVAAIMARGGQGSQGGYGGFGWGGGGGSGGVVLLRAGGTLTAGGIDVQGGGGGVSSGQPGAAGRVRYDAAGAVTIPDQPLGTQRRRGPMFTELPLTFRTARPELAVVGEPLAVFRYFFIEPGGAVSRLSSALFDATGAARVELSEDLASGTNLLCTVADSGTELTETRNCASVAYLP